MFSYQNTINIRVGVETNLLILRSLRVPAGLLFSAGHSRVNTLIETLGSIESNSFHIPMKQISQFALKPE